MIKKIMISQPKPASEKSPYYDIEKEYGVELIFVPLSRSKASRQKSFGSRK